MNDSMSILLASTILALGGLGLYMYKSSNDNESEEPVDEIYNESSIFGSNFFGGGDENESKSDESNDTDEEVIKTRKRNNGKTYRNRKLTGASRRRY